MPENLHRKPNPREWFRKKQRKILLRDPLFRFRDSFPEHSCGINNKLRVVISSAHAESEFAVTIAFAENPAKNVQLKLGADEESIIVNALQGPNITKVDYPERTVAEINSELGEPWPNFGLRAIEEHAKTSGFKTVKIADSTALYYYRYPHIDGVPDHLFSERVNQRIAFLKNRIANGKKPQLNADEIAAVGKSERFVSSEIKKGKRVLYAKNMSETNWRVFRAELMDYHKKRYVQKSILNLYSNAIRANGYRKKGDYFVKEL